MPVNTPRREYNAMLSKWQRSRDCFEGSDAVKAAGTRYLPLLDSHRGQRGAEKYDEYRLRALFFNAMGRTVEGMSGALFQAAPEIRVPAVIEPHLEDITLDGLSAEGFGLKIVRELLITGRVGVLVDFPEDTDAPGETRPYWTMYRAEDVISWRTERIEGRLTLTQVVLFELTELPGLVDPFVVDEIEQYRVLDLVEGQYLQQIWRKKPNSETWEPFGSPIVPTRRGDPLTQIPFTVLTAIEVSPSIQKPPLLDLVEVNLSHYRTSADLEHGRHFTALPTPWVAGAIAGTAKGAPLHIGSGTAWSLEKEGRAGMLEFTGQGLGALEKADEQKRKMMAVLGARLLEDQSGAAETATAVSMRHAGEQASLRTIAQTSEAALTRVLRIHAWWMGSDASPDELSDVKYEINKNYFSTRLTSSDLQALVMALQAEAISFETFYAQLQKGEIARPGVTAEEEDEAIARRSEALAGQAEGGEEPEPGEPEELPGAMPGDEVLAEAGTLRIVRRNGKFVLVENSDGKVVGTFRTQDQAEKAALKLLEEVGE